MCCRVMLGNLLGNPGMNVFIKDVSEGKKYRRHFGMFHFCHTTVTRPVTNRSYQTVVNGFRSLSVSSVSSVSSASSSSSSVRSADSDDMYADLASPVSSASSHSPTPNHPRKERGPARDRPPHAKDKSRG